MLVTLNSETTFPDVIFANNQQDTIYVVDQVLISSNVAEEIVIRYEDGTPILTVTPEVDKTNIYRSTAAITNAAKGKDIEIYMGSALEGTEQINLYFELKRINVPPTI
jgi:hypothetical protein